MGNSALKSHLETSQKTGVFQLTAKGLQEVGGAAGRKWKQVTSCLSSAVPSNRTRQKIKAVGIDELVM